MTIVAHVQRRRGVANLGRRGIAYRCCNLAPRGGKAQRAQGPLRLGLTRVPRGDAAE